MFDIKIGNTELQQATVCYFGYTITEDNCCLSKQAFQKKKKFLTLNI